MDCVFCKIVDKQIPNYTVFEDGKVLAFLDIHPCAKGHTVVIPKQHGETVFDFDESARAQFMNGIEKTMRRLGEVLTPDGFNVGWNHGQAGGQAVPHLHAHIIPRWNSDGGGSMHSIVRHPGETSVADLAKLFL